MATLAGGHAGVARYAAALSEALDQVAPGFPDLRLEAVTTPAGAETLAFVNIPVQTARLPRGAERRGWARLLLEQAQARRGHPELLHFFDLIGPVFARRRRFVATIHDAAITYDDFAFPRLRRAYKRPLQPWALKRAAAVVAVSAFARDEAVRRLGGDPARIHVIHSGPGLIAPARGIDGTAPPRPPYLLFVGTLADNKNLPFLVRAFDNTDVDVELVLAGRRASATADLEAAIERAGARDRIRLLEDVSDADIDELYRGAIALVHPSLYEGFGFTPLEAMARGCPVLLSDVPALREVSGDGAVVLPVGDEAAWSGAIRRVVGDETLRADLRKRGTDVVSRYSWEQTARRLCQLFLEVGGDH